MNSFEPLSNCSKDDDDDDIYYTDTDSLNIEFFFTPFWNSKSRPNRKEMERKQNENGPRKKCLWWWLYFFAMFLASKIVVCLSTSNFDLLKTATNSRNFTTD